MMKFFAAPVYSEAGGMASVSVFRGDEGIYVGEMQMSRRRRSSSSSACVWARVSR